MIDGRDYYLSQIRLVDNMLKNDLCICYHVLYNLRDFVYLNERLFLSDEDEIENEEENNDECSASTNDIISIDEERKMQQANLLATAQLFLFKCWLLASST